MGRLEFLNEPQSEFTGELSNENALVCTYFDRVNANTIFHNKSYRSEQNVVGIFPSAIATRIA